MGFPLPFWWITDGQRSAYRHQLTFSDIWFRPYKKRKEKVNTLPFPVLFQQDRDRVEDSLREEKPSISFSLVQTLEPPMNKSDGGWGAVVDEL